MKKSEERFPLVRVMETSVGSFLYDGITNRIISLATGVTQIDIDEKRLEELCAKRLISHGRLNEIKWPFSLEQYLWKQEHCLDRLVLQLTRRCNMRCEYCVYSGEFSNMKPHASQDMTEECMLKSIDFFLKRANPSVRKEVFFYGGESLLCFGKIKRAVEYAKGDNIRFVVSSNGLLLSDEFLVWLSENKNVEVHITLNGPYHDKYRKDVYGKETLAVILNNVYHAKAAYPMVWNDQIQFICNIMSENELDAIEVFFENLGKLPHVITAVSAYMGSDKMKTLVNSDRESQLEHMSSLKKYIDENSEFLFPYYGIELTRINCRTIYKDNIGWISSCFPLDSTLFVQADGSLNLCEKMCDYVSVGNIETGINNENIQHLFNQMKELTNKQCKSCWAQRLCPMCFQNVFDENGNMLDSMPETWCDKQRNVTEENLKLYYEIGCRFPNRLTQFVYKG